MNKLMRSSLTPKQNFIYAMLGGAYSVDEISDDMLIVHDDFDEALKFLEENILTLKEAVAINTYIFGGKRYVDTAKVLGVSPNRARQLVNNGLRKCRRYKNYFLMGYHECKKKEELLRNGMFNGTDVDSIDLTELGLSNSTCNTLKRAGLNTVGDIRKVEVEKLMRVRNLGTKRFKELTDELALLGVVLR